jgi:hypothetical protein
LVDEVLEKDRERTPMPKDDMVRKCAEEIGLLCGIRARPFTIESIIRTHLAPVLEDVERLDWLLDRLVKEPDVHITKNPYTGTFIVADRFLGYRDGEERWEQERLAQGPPGDDGRAAIDAARGVGGLS